MRTSLLLDLVADAAPGRVAVDGPNGTLTYGALRAAARALAARLEGSVATIVGFLGMNSPALPVALFGSAYAGRALCPLNYRLTDERLQRLVERLAPVVVVADRDFGERVAGVDGVEVLWADAVGSTPAPEPAVNAPREDDAVAVVLYTSGTSGEPKAATLRHSNLTAYVLQTVDFLGAADDEATLVSIPPYHVAGIAALLTSVYAGRRVVQLPAFEPAAWVSVAASYGATHAMLVPTMLDRVLDAADRAGADLAGLRAIAYGGGRMPFETIARALRRLPAVSFVNAYGLTETSSTIAILGPEDHARARDGDPAARARLKSVGRPIPGVEIEIRDESGRRVESAATGEVWVRGEQVSGAYADRSGGLSDGWFATRDRGWFDAEGYLYVDGRLDDVIVRGGENISPGEIEDVLRAHPTIADAAVVGIPDAAWGERIVAFLVLATGKELCADDLREWVRTRLRSTRTPDSIYVRAVLPYNELGKLLRRQLRDELASGGN